MSDQDGGKRPEVDAIIPVYGERSEALAATLSACLKQTFPVSRIFVVDDGSPEPVSLPAWAESSPQISLIRLSENQGISAARNAAIARSSATFLACVNTEVLPDPDWLATCHDYLAAHPNSDNRWRIMTAIGDVYAAKGDTAKAREQYDKAMAAAPDAADREEVQDSINAMGAGGQ